MKRILSIIAAGALAVLALSCNKDEKAVLKPADVTAPVLGEVSVGANVVVKYTPAVFTMSFNEKMPVYHTLGMVSVNDEACDVTLSAAKDDGAALTLKGKALTDALLLRGFEIGETVKLEVVVRASIQDPSKGVTNGYVDSADKAEINWTLKEEKQGGIPTHDGVRVYIIDETLWPAITLYMWGDVNDFGGGWPGKAVDGEFGDWKYFEYGNDIFGLAQHLIFNNNGGGTQLADYDITFESGVADYWLKVTADGVEEADAPAGDIYGDWEETNEWGAIGSIASTGNSWNADEPMLTNGTWFVARNIELTTADEFKFRKDAAWTVNFGGDCAAIGTEFAVTQDGPNIKVPADGTYDLLLNPSAAVAKIVVAGENPGI